MNDWLLKINDMDLTNKDRKQVVKAVLNGGGLINMVVRRKKYLGGRLGTPVHINLMGHKGQLEFIFTLICFPVCLILYNFIFFFVFQTVALVWKVGCLLLPLSRVLLQPGKAPSQLETDWLL